VPPALVVALVSVAVSVTEVPAFMLNDEGFVDSEGVAWLTVIGPSQALGAPSLLASPLYTAVKLTAPEPTLLMRKFGEDGTTPPVTVTVEEATGAPLQTPLLKRLYLTVPPAVGVAVVKIAESETVFPTTTVLAEGVVESEGLSFLTVTGPSQELIDPAFLDVPDGGSPL